MVTASNATQGPPALLVSVARTPRRRSAASGGPVGERLSTEEGQQIAAGGVIEDAVVGGHLGQVEDAVPYARPSPVEAARPDHLESRRLHFVGEDVQGVLRLVIGVYERILFEPAHRGIGGVEGQV